MNRFYLSSLLDSLSAVAEASAQMNWVGGTRNLVREQRQLSSVTGGAGATAGQTGGTLFNIEQIDRKGNAFSDATDHLQRTRDSGLASPEPISAHTSVDYPDGSGCKTRSVASAFRQADVRSPMARKDKLRGVHSTSAQGDRNQQITHMQSGMNNSVMVSSRDTLICRPQATSGCNQDMHPGSASRDRDTIPYRASASYAFTYNEAKLGENRPMARKGVASTSHEKSLSKGDQGSVRTVGGLTVEAREQAAQVMRRIAAIKPVHFNPVLETIGTGIQDINYMREGEGRMHHADWCPKEMEERDDQTHHDLESGGQTMIDGESHARGELQACPHSSTSCYLGRDNGDALAAMNTSPDTGVLPFQDLADKYYMCEGNCSLGNGLYCCHDSSTEYTAGADDHEKTGLRRFGETKGRIHSGRSINMPSHEGLWEGMGPHSGVHAHITREHATSDQQSHSWMPHDSGYRGLHQRHPGPSYHSALPIMDTGHYQRLQPFEVPQPQQAESEAVVCMDYGVRPSQQWRSPRVPAVTLTTTTTTTTMTSTFQPPPASFHLDGNPQPNSTGSQISTAFRYPDGVGPPTDDVNSSERYASSAAPSLMSVSSTLHDQGNVRNTAGARVSQQTSTKPFRPSIVPTERPMGTTPSRQTAKECRSVYRVNPVLVTPVRPRTDPLGTAVHNEEEGYGRHKAHIDAECNLLMRSFGGGKVRGSKHGYPRDKRVTGSGDPEKKRQAPRIGESMDELTSDDEIGIDVFDMNWELPDTGVSCSKRALGNGLSEMSASLWTKGRVREGTVEQEELGDEWRSFVPPSSSERFSLGYPSSTSLGSSNSDIDAPNRVELSWITKGPVSATKLRDTSWPDSAHKERQYHTKRDSRECGWGGGAGVAEQGDVWMRCWVDSPRGSEDMRMDRANTDVPAAHTKERSDARPRLESQTQWSDIPQQEVRVPSEGQVVKCYVEEDERLRLFRSGSANSNDSETDNRGGWLVWPSYSKAQGRYGGRMMKGKNLSGEQRKIGQTHSTYMAPGATQSSENSDADEVHCCNEVGLDTLVRRCGQHYGDDSNVEMGKASIDPDRVDVKKSNGGDDVRLNLDYGRAKYEGSGEGEGNFPYRLTTIATPEVMRCLHMFNLEGDVDGKASGRMYPRTTMVSPTNPVGEYDQPAWKPQDKQPTKRVLSPCRIELIEDEAVDDLQSLGQGCNDPPKEPGDTNTRTSTCTVEIGRKRKAPESGRNRDSQLGAKEGVGKVGTELREKARVEEYTIVQYIGEPRARQPLTGDSATADEPLKKKRKVSLDWKGEDGEAKETSQARGETTLIATGTMITSSQETLLAGAVPHTPPARPYTQISNGKTRDEEAKDSKGGLELTPITPLQAVSSSHIQLHVVRVGSVGYGLSQLNNSSGQPYEMALTSRMDGSMTDVPDPVEAIEHLTKKSKNSCQTTTDTCSAGLAGSAVAICEVNEEDVGAEGAMRCTIAAVAPSPAMSACSSATTSLSTRTVETSFYASSPSSDYR